MRKLLFVTLILMSSRLSAKEMAKGVFQSFREKLCAQFDKEGLPSKTVNDFEASCAESSDRTDLQHNLLTWGTRCTFDLVRDSMPDPKAVLDTRDNSLEIQTNFSRFCDEKADHISWLSYCVHLKIQNGNASQDLNQTLQAFKKCLKEWDKRGEEFAKAQKKNEAAKAEPAAVPAAPAAPSNPSSSAATSGAK